MTTTNSLIPGTTSLTKDIEAPPQVQGQGHVDDLRRGGEGAPTDVDERRRVRIHAGQTVASPVFAWATVGTRALVRYGRMAGWRTVEEWVVPSGERHLVALRALA
ncbi:hypothetical protein [Streptomyces sp. NPDC017949]|uniref:hypothetical protein n=1 Tax=Streptomyces sp. NPDC017949 TaxID=3365020 RepID=UPI00378D4561